MLPLRLSRMPSQSTLDEPSTIRKSRVAPFPIHVLRTKLTLVEPLAMLVTEAQLPAQVEPVVLQRCSVPAGTFEQPPAPGVQAETGENLR